MTRSSRRAAEASRAVMWWPLARARAVLVGFFGVVALAGLAPAASASEVAAWLTEDGQLGVAGGPYAPGAEVVVDVNPGLGSWQQTVIADGAGSVALSVPLGADVAQSMGLTVLGNVARVAPASNPLAATYAPFDVGGLELALDALPSDGATHVGPVTLGTFAAPTPETGALTLALLDAAGGLVVTSGGLAGGVGPATLVVSPPDPVAQWVTVSEVRLTGQGGLGAPLFVYDAGELVGFHVGGLFELGPDHAATFLHKAASESPTPCGDGVVQGYEVCDDGTTSPGGGCSPDCASVTPGFVCPELGGACDCQPGRFGAECLGVCPGGAATPCSDQGSCDDGVGGSGACTCDGAWIGAACDVCPVEGGGVWGAQCAACAGGADTPCSNHGVCDDALAGDTGTCTCDPGWSGAACELVADAAAATVTIVAPVSNFTLPWDPLGGGGVAVTVAVEGATVGLESGQVRVVLFVDGVPVAETHDPSLPPFVLTDLAAGRRHLAVRLLSPAGDGLDAPGSQDQAYVRVVPPCEVPEDCYDGQTCTTVACYAGTCAYGGLAGCCDHDLQCPQGWHCAGGTCRQCLEGAHCQDGDPCTVDICGSDGMCQNLAEQGCCTTDSSCDDGDDCTADQCVAGACQFEDLGHPGCCTTTADCDVPDPCVTVLCYNPISLDHGICRIGPKAPGCCDAAEDCHDGNPCTEDVCALDPGALTGSCEFADPPGKACCVTSADCLDSAPDTLDLCVSNQCVHLPDPDYCALPATSALVVHEVMLDPGPPLGVYGRWIEVMRPYDAGSWLSLEGWTLELWHGDGAVESHVVSAVGAVGGPASLTLGPGDRRVLSQVSAKAATGGTPVDYRFGSDLTLLPPGSAPGGQQTLRLLDPSGAVVDEVTWSETWPLATGAATELTHPHADNADPDQWAVAEAAPELPGGGRFGVLKLIGSPGLPNRASEVALPDPACGSGEALAPCQIGACGVDSRCALAPVAGCCQASSDCDDGDPCTPDWCDLDTSTCAVDPALDGCCVTAAQCDDGNPCNLDRCIGHACRHSPNVVPGCCSDDTECESADPCLRGVCLPGQYVCAFEAVPLSPGDTCCLVDAECDDDEPSTLNQCDPGTQLCVFPPDPSACASEADCDDGDPCTLETCDPGTATCVSVAVAGCCSSDDECGSPDPCVVSSCDAATSTCTTSPIAGCCQVSEHCDDADVCTTDVCLNGSCRHFGQPGCCTEDLDCTGSGPCTSGTCVDGACVDEVVLGCCTDAMGPDALQAVCGADPDGAGLCWHWACVSGACDAVLADGCCETAADCVDGSPCTEDLCQGGVCLHLVLEPEAAGCCADDADCDAGSWCQVGSGSCMPAVGLGEACESDNACVDGVCAGGVCVPCQVDGDCPGPLSVCVTYADGPVCVPPPVWCAAVDFEDVFGPLAGADTASPPAPGAGGFVSVGAGCEVAGPVTAQGPAVVPGSGSGDSLRLTLGGSSGGAGDADGAGPLEVTFRFQVPIDLLVFQAFDAYGGDIEVVAGDKLVHIFEAPYAQPDLVVLVFGQPTTQVTLRSDQTPWLVLDDLWFDGCPGSKTCDSLGVCQ